MGLGFVLVVAWVLVVYIVLGLYGIVIVCIYALCVFCFGLFIGFVLVFVSLCVALCGSGGFGVFIML